MEGREISNFFPLMATNRHRTEGSEDETVPVSGSVRPRRDEELSSPRCLSPHSSKYSLSHRRVVGLNFTLRSYSIAGLDGFVLKGEVTSGY